MQQEQTTNHQRRKSIFYIVGAVVAVVIVIVVVIMIRGSHTNTKVVVPAIVDITSHGFVPQDVRVKVGQGVKWVNIDRKPHQPATDPYPLENGLSGFRAAAPLQMSQSYTFTFDKTGVFTYHDHLNPLKFKGSVIVQ